jgi:hypothetical protein
VVEATASILSMAKHLAVSQNSDGLTPLHVAIANHCSKCVLTQLISLVPRSVAIADFGGMNALHYVASFGTTSWSFAEKLASVCPELIHQQTVNGDTPLHLLVANTGMDYFPGMHVESSQTSGYHDASHTMKLVILLLGQKDEAKQPLLIQNMDGLTPLHCCAKLNTPTLLTQTLLESDHASIAATVVTGNEETPLKLAMSTLAEVGDSHDAIGLRNALANVASLATPEACVMFDSKNRTPLMNAVQSKKWSTIQVKILLAAHRESASQVTSDGFLALHYACQNKKIKASTVKGTSIS